MRELSADRVFTDMASGSTAKRPGMEEMISFVRDGDTVVVESISRIARNASDLLNIIDALSAKGVGFVSRKEAIDTTMPTGKFMLTVFGAVAELEREYILQRQHEGIEQARAQGKYQGRRPIDIDSSLWEKVYSQWRLGKITAVEAQKDLSCPHPLSTAGSDVKPLITYLFSTSLT